MDNELAFTDATGQADLVARGEATPLELVQAGIERVEALNGQLNAVIHERFEAAGREAAGPLSGPLAGVPILLKDLGAPMAGEPMHAGMAVLKQAGFRPGRDAFLVSKLRAAGCVVLGRTNCPEMGTNITTEPLAYGPARNPWSLDHSTGGSSGGSAAAVASGMVPVAHGNDGGGSIRIPAANCGLFGLKPSRGRVSPGPEPSESSWAGSTIDHMLTRTVRDSATLLDILSGEMPGDLFVAPPPARRFAEEVGAEPGRLKIGLLDHSPRAEYQCDPVCAAAAQSAGALLERLGHTVVQGAYPKAMSDEDFQRHFVVLVTTAVAQALSSWSTVLGRTVEASELEPDNQMFAALGGSVPATTYLETLLWAEGWRRAMASFWSDEGYDLLLSPVLAVTPPRLGELSEPGVGQERVVAALQFTPHFNLSGQPAMSLPLCWTDDGLPVGVQLVAAYGREDLLLRVASQVEQAAPWAERKPPVQA
ncbi:MAG: amidase [Acidimicrobiales bacterium]